MKTALLQPSFIDSVFSAQVSRNKNTSLGQIALMHDKHILCRALNSSAVSMDEGICTKWFPKQFLKETGQDDAQMYLTFCLRRATDDKR